MIMKFKDNTDPEMVADLILRLIRISMDYMQDKTTVQQYNHDTAEIWKEFYLMTENRIDDIPF